MNRKILIIEDEVYIAELLKVNFEAEGYEVASFATGENGLIKIFTEGKKYDIVLLDARLPGISGWDVCKRIKTDHSFKHTPVIFITAATQKRDQEQAKDCNADLYISKPFDIQDVIKKIRDILKSRKKILVAEDDEMIIELLKVNLEACGYEFISALDGDEAIDKIKSERPDLIILDIIIPKMDGWEVCKVIKDNSEFENIKIIMLTAKNHERDKMIGLDILKADKYIVKPFDIDTLISNVKELLNE